MEAKQLTRFRRELLRSAPNGSYTDCAAGNICSNGLVGVPVVLSVAASFGEWAD